MTKFSVLCNLIPVGQVYQDGAQQGTQQCALDLEADPLTDEPILDTAFTLTSSLNPLPNIDTINQNIRNVLISASDSTIAADAEAKYEIYNSISTAISTINASKVKIDTVRTNNFNAIRDARQIPFENIKSQIRTAISKYPEDIETNNLPPLLLNLANKITTQNEIKLTYQNALQSYLNFLSPPRQNNRPALGLVGGGLGGLGTVNTVA